MTPTQYNNPYIPLLSAAGGDADTQMDFPAPEFQEPISTPPKLSLYSLPTKPSTLPEGLTPPPNAVAAIPFLWEEVPGKPRLTTTTTTTDHDDPPKSKTVRSLDLPPRLTPTPSTPAAAGTGTLDIIPSPTTVLSGPYEGAVYASNSLLRSPEKVVGSNNKSSSKGKITMPLRKLMRKERSPPVKFSSWRWDSFRDIDGGGKVERSPSVRFCSWRLDSFRDMSGVAGGGCLCSSAFDDLKKSHDSGSKTKTGKLTRKNSLTFSNATSSSFLANMYGTLKQAMPWRSRR